MISSLTNNTLLLRRRWLAWAVAAALAAVSARLLVFKLSAQPLCIDFLAMWTGGRMTNPYDVAAVDHAQAWLLGAAAHDRPFPYPPSALLVFGPLGRLPFWTASAVWMTVTLAAFALVALLLLPGRQRLLGAALLAVLPGVVWAALSGQISFLIGALAIGGVALLDRRPLLAGALLGVAAAFKPTVLLLAPVALIAGGHWRALAGAMLGGLATIAASVLAYGLAPWLAWIAGASGYLAHITGNPRFFTSIITPMGLAAQLGLKGWVLTVWRLAFTAAGLAVAILVFRRKPPLATRLTALIGASLLASPYAMNYETVLLAPGAVLAVVESRGRITDLAAYVALALAGLPVISPIAFLIYILLALNRDGSRPITSAPRP